jgi:hypothetical protein
MNFFSAAPAVSKSFEISTLGSLSSNICVSSITGNLIPAAE